MGETEIEKMGVRCLAPLSVMRSCQLFVSPPAPGWRIGWGPKRQMLNELLSLCHIVSLC